MTQTPVTPAVSRQAKRMIHEATIGPIGDRFRELCIQAQANPRRVAELVIALAEFAAERPDDFAATHEEHLKAAHAAYARGERLPWVVDGERAYNAERMARRRAKAKELDTTGKVAVEVGFG